MRNFLQFLKLSYLFFMVCVAGYALSAEKPDNRDQQKIRFEKAAKFDQYTFEYAGGEFAGAFGNACKRGKNL